VTAERANDAPHRESYWFPARRYGWGWGPPATWQGWVVLAVWFVALIGGTPLLLLGHFVLWLTYLLALSLLLMVVCYRKGEPPRWRWGERSP
jgi:hypothetical protein